MAKCNLKTAPVQVLHANRPLQKNLSTCAVIDEDSANIWIQFASEVLSQFEAECILESLRTGLKNLIQSPLANLCQLEIVSERDKGLIYEWNKQQPEYVDSCVHRLIQRQSLLRPNAPAVHSWEKEFTYKELDETTTRLARHLRHVGINKGDMVPFCFNKSIWTVVSTLSTLKVGGVPVALDLGSPRGRVDAILQKTQAKLALIGSNLDHVLADVDVKSITVDESLLITLSYRTSSELESVSSKDVAFVQFTSGSTGTPKGIILDHRAFCTSSLAICSAQNIDQNSRVLQFAAHSFDACLQEIFTTLIAGGCVCIPSETSRLNALAEAMEEMNVNWAFMTPTLAKLLRPSDIPTLKTLILGGETAGKDLINVWFGAVNLMNGYGPSECGICCSVSSSLGVKEPNNIGRSLQSANLWIVCQDDHDQLAPIGSVGELVVQGPGLSREYLNDAKATLAGFVHGPSWLASRYPERLQRVYKTGDLGRYLQDGTIQFLGRKDNQIKFHGQRIELSEIERAIVSILPDGDDAFVEVVDTGVVEENLQKSLVAFHGPTVPNREYKEDSRPPLLKMDCCVRQTEFLLEKRLTEILPLYMVPKIYVPLLHMPTTGSGKLDRRTLRTLVSELTEDEIGRYSLRTSGDVVLPRTSHEATLRDLWANTLRISSDSISVDDSFFRLGGESVLAIKLAGAARHQGFTLTVAEIFEKPKLSSQALNLQSFTDKDKDIPRFCLLDDKETALEIALAQCKVEADQIDDILPCTTYQEDAFRASGEKMEAHCTHVVCNIPFGMDNVRLQDACDTLVQQNSILRTSFIETPQKHLLQVVTKGAVDVGKHHSMEKCLVAHELRPIQKGVSLLAFSVVDETKKTNAKMGRVVSVSLVLTMHQSLHDGVSIAGLETQLKDLLQRGRTPPVRSFSHFIEFVATMNLSASIPFWRSQLANSNLTKLPATLFSPTLRYKPQHLTLPETRLKQNHRPFTTSTVIRLAWALVLGCHCSSDDIIFGLTLSGREAPVAGVEYMTGPTSTTIPLRIRVSDGQSIASALESIQAQSIAMIPHVHFGIKRIAAIDSDCASACQLSSNLAMVSLLDGGGDHLSHGVDAGRRRLNLFLQIGCPLTIICAASDSGLTVRVEMIFDQGIISEIHASAMLSQFQSILKQLTAKPLSTKLEAIDRLGPVDYRQLREWNCEVSPPKNACAHELIQTRCFQQPEAIAVDSSERRLTYRELETRASQLAKHLLSRGLDPAEDVVPLCFEKSIWTVVSILGVMKAGAAFLLMDASHPLQRLQTIFQEVDGKIVLCSKKTSAKTTALTQACVIVDSVLFEHLDAHPSRLAPIALPEVRSDHTMFVFYTSGSTGVPKGHRTAHRAYCSAVERQIEMKSLGPGTRILQYSSYAFDVSLEEIVTSLVAGACVCVPTEDERANDMHNFMRKLYVNYAILTPTVARILDPEDLPELQTLMLAGEQVQAVDLQIWADRLTLMNAYGPSECSICTCINTRMLPNSNPAIVGKSTWAKFWVVDPSDAERLQPVGVVGELLIEGHHVGDGYVNDEEKTRRAFIKSPGWMSSFTSKPDSRGRFYKTGDLAILNHNNSLTFVGRKDTQVKLRGQRIELGEVESQAHRALTGSGIVYAVAEVLPPAGLVRSESLALFLQFTDSHENDAIAPVEIQAVKVTQIQTHVLQGFKTKLDTSLPSYMVPKYYIAVESMPLQPSGKINRMLLRQIAKDLTAAQLAILDTTNGTKVKPDTPKEREIVRLCAQVLNLDQKSLGINDNFLHLGGDSIGAIRLVSAARKAGLQLSVAEIFENPVLGHLASMSTAASVLQSPSGSQRSGELIERISREWNIPYESIEDVYPCTPLQKSLLALTKRNPRTNTLRHVFRISKEVDISLFRASWEYVMLTNPILRTKVVFVKSSILQVVLKIDIVWRADDDLQNYLLKDFDDPFDYGSELVRFALIPDANGGFHFVFTAHHVTYDGWSDSQVHSLVKDAYHGSNNNSSSPYRNFITYLENTTKENQGSFWKNELDGFSGTIFPQLPKPGYWPMADKSVTEHTAIPKRLSLSDITLPTVIRAAWALTMSQFSNSSDVVFGAIQTGRNAPLPDIADIVGPTIAVVPIRIDFSRTSSVIEFLSSVQRQTTRMMPFEHFGLQNIEALNPDCRAACAFQNLLIIQPKFETKVSIDGVQHVQTIDTEFPSYGLSVECTIGNELLNLHANYDSSVLSATETRHIIRQFGHMLHQLSTHTNERLDDLDIISPSDLKSINSLNSINLDPIDKCVHWEIERQMKLNPEAPAVNFHGEEFSYRQLDTFTSILAAQLRELGVGPEVVVPFCVDKSLEAVVGILSILRAGGVGTALDPTHPASRRRLILDETKAEVILTLSRHSELFKDMEFKIVEIDNSTSLQPGQEPVALARGHVMPHNAAFLVFTSGSTGVAKGIILEHASICATARGNQEALELIPSSRVLQFASFVFDVSIEDVCITLMSGACLCVISESDRVNDLSGAMRASRVSWADLTPTVARTIDPEMVPSLQTLVLGGEMLTDDIIKQWSRRVHLFNTYGPAECTIYSTTTTNLGLEAKGNNIGHSIGCNCWVTDPTAHHRLSPLGCVGELLIQGPNLARCYLNDEEKTRNAFFEPTWMSEEFPENQRRCYKTGDLVRQNFDGTLEFVARKDAQLKLRGQRLEAGEIEHHFMLQTSHRFAAVVEIITHSDQQILAIFYGPSNPSERAVQANAGPILPMSDTARSDMLKIKDALNQYLPSYMVPSAFIPLSTMPTLTSGKADRKLLRFLGNGLVNEAMQEYYLTNTKAQKKQPTDDQERKIQGMWAAVLGLDCEAIGIDDSFFQLGGESVAAIRLAAAARRMGLQLSVADIFHHPTLLGMSASVKPFHQPNTHTPNFPEGSGVTELISREWNIDYERIEDVYRCTWLQNNMIEVTRRKPEANVMQFAFQIKPTVCIDRLSEAWQQVVAENPIFRTRIVRVGLEQTYQVVLEERIDWQKTDLVEAGELADGRRLFDYGTPLSRFAIVPERNTKNHRLIWIAHHAIYDGWSITQVLSMVAAKYHNANSSLQSNPVSFKDLIRYISNLEKETSYKHFWTSQLATFSSSVFPRLPSRTYVPLTNSRLEFSLTFPPHCDPNITRSTILRAAWALVLSNQIQERDIVFGAIQTGRSIPLTGVTEIIGPVITLIPVRIKWSKETSMTDFLNSIQQQSADTIPYEHIDRSLIAALSDEDGAAEGMRQACAFQSLLIVQPPAQEPVSIDGVERIQEGAIEQDWLPYALSVECVLPDKEERMSVKVDFDSDVLDNDEVRGLVKMLNEMVIKLCDRQGDRDLCT